jgi:tetraacyldisaccharide 4'-kinase
MRARRWAYQAVVLPRGSVDVPVICAGNITTGGTGKTPMVANLAGLVKNQLGLNPAILTRGYKSAAGLSDEAQLLREITGAAVIVNPNRLAGARQALVGGADVLIMDDGFQHLQLRRNLDIVLIDATNPFGSGPGRAGCCLPTGRLREPAEALRYAHVIIITRSEQVEALELDRLDRLLCQLAPAALLLRASHAPTGVVDQAGQVRPAGELAGRKVFAFCGLGNPAAFMRSVASLGGQLVGREALADHVAYTPRTIAKLGQAAANCGAEIMLTTRKDGVKLRHAKLPLPVWQLDIEMKIDDPQGMLLEKIRTILRKSIREQG